MLCCRPVPAQEYAQWLPCFEAAKTTMQDREAALDAAAELIERDLLLLGATAIEDKLQQARLPASIDASPEEAHRAGPGAAWRHCHWRQAAAGEPALSNCSRCAYCGELQSL